jgi:glycosyltransferase involved in cell wall biosynthesis
VWHLRSAPPNHGADWRSRLIRRALVRFSDVTIAINEDVAALWDVPAEIVPDPVELHRFSPGNQTAARAQLRVPAHGHIVAYIGFLYPVKGYREVIHAAALVRDRGIDATYLIVGGGVRPPAFFFTLSGRTLRLLGLARDYETEARQLIAELDLGAQVRQLRAASQRSVRDREREVGFSSPGQRHSLSTVMAPDPLQMPLPSF